MRKKKEKRGGLQTIGGEERGVEKRERGRQGVEEENIGKEQRHITLIAHVRSLVLN